MKKKYAPPFVKLTNDLTHLYLPLMVIFILYFFFFFFGQKIVRPHNEGLHPSALSDSMERRLQDYIKAIHKYQVLDFPNTTVYPQSKRLQKH